MRFHAAATRLAAAKKVVVFTGAGVSQESGIAELESLLPQVVVVTQNIDGLHQAAGSSDVIELHGTLHRAKCLSSEHTGYSFAEMLAEDEKPPPCPECGEPLRPDVVWFGEPLPHEAWRRAQRLTKACDVLLMAGTSAVVYPAAMLPRLALDSGATVIDVNTEPDAVSRRLQDVLRGPAGEVLPELVAAVRECRGTIAS